MHALAPFLALVLAPAAHALDSAEILSLLEVGVPADIAVQTIEGSGSTFTRSDVRLLESAGAPPRVVDAVRRLVTAEPEPPAPVEAPPPPSSDFDQAPALGAGGEAPPEARGEGRIDQLVRLVQARKLLTASKGLFELLEDDTIPDEASRLHYYLGSCLWELDLPHSAQHHLLEVARRGPRDPYFRYAVPRLVAIAERTGDHTDLARLARALPPGDVPARAEAHFAWLRGLHHVDQGDLTAGLRELQRVPADHPLYPRARYVEGAVQYERGKLESAARAFADVLEAELHARSEAELAELQELQDLALVGLGRTHFAVGNHDRAERYYGWVRQESRWWPVSMYERAWSRFHRADTDRTLGLLLAVHSPYHAREAHPEATWLEALSWFQLCEWVRAEALLLGLEGDLEPRLAATRGLVERYGDPSAASLLDEAWEEVWASEAALGDHALLGVVRKGVVDGLVSHLVLLEEEEARIRDQKVAWRDGVGTHLLEVLERDRTRLRRRAGAAAIEELGRQAVELADLLERSRLLRFEIVDGQRRHFEVGPRWVDPAVVEPRVGAYATSPSTVYWPWNGEYWEDELPHYRYDQPSRCQAL